MKMKIWKNSPLDAVMLGLSLTQAVVMFTLAARWEHAAVIERAGSFALLVFMITYNIVIISHLFTHTPWFESRPLNSLASMLNSIDIGQSAQAYQLTHVRNHHRYNNDRKGPDGRTKDTTSTFADGKGGEHDSVWHYAFVGAAITLRNTVRNVTAVRRLWGVGPHEQALRKLAVKDPVRHARELRQVRLDRMAHVVALVAFALISWQWTLMCYVPAFYLALALVNVHNYYEHYGAAPGSRYTDSVSYYGRLYNLLTFNDGYHQEHHLRPQTHWTRMPTVRREHAAALNQVERIISPVPALLGFLHRTRPLLHRRVPVAAPPNPPEESADRNSLAG
jgi:fatty acid desaturase